MRDNQKLIKQIIRKIDKNICIAKEYANTDFQKGLIKGMKISKDMINKISNEPKMILSFSDEQIKHMIKESIERIFKDEDLKRELMVTDFDQFKQMIVKTSEWSADYAINFKNQWGE